jgi:glycosyltransferase involved in cell wall biosynthesis
VSVALAYVHDKETAHSFQVSIEDLVFYDLAHDQHLYGVKNPHRMRYGAGGLVAARNHVAQQVMDGDYEWLLWIDTDMGFEPDSLDRLMAVADPKTRPIVGGLCFAMNETGVDGYGGYHTVPRVTIYDWVEERTPRGFVSRVWYEPNALTACDATGGAFVLIHRSVLEKIHAEYGPAWYDQAKGDEGLVAEDLSFCMRAKALGFPIFVHSGVRTTHMKTVWLSAADFWADPMVQPATEQCAVLVPVMKRPESAEPFMRSLRASTSLATAYAIYDEDDIATRDAWKAAGAQLLPSSGPSFATKINDGYRNTDEPWLFLVGDDVAFHPGWLDHAQFAGKITEASVIGTNDLGNPRVMRGEHATHMLIRRKYVDEQGASWDGPGVVCHVGYRHWFVDDELVHAAKERNVWSMALASKVEHLHPLFKKGQSDETYRIGQLYADKDRKTFAKRLANH